MKVYKKVIDAKNQQVLKHVQEIVDVLTKYFGKLEDGTHVLIIPDPFIETSEEEADKLIFVIDDYFTEKESWRMRNNLVDIMPEFFRLCPNARKAMCQEIKQILKYQKEHIEDYLEEMSEDAFSYEGAS